MKAEKDFRFLTLDNTIIKLDKNHFNNSFSGSSKARMIFDDNKSEINRI